MNLKLILSALTLTAGLAALPLLAQDPPPPAPKPVAPPPGTPPPLPPPSVVPPAKATPPGTPPPGAPPLPGLEPPPPPAEVPDGFKTEKERQSYALGSFFATREKNGSASGGLPPPNVDEMMHGMKDVLSGKQSLDYAIGAQLAVQIRRIEVDIDPEVLAQAVREVMTGQPSKLTPQQNQMVIQRIQTELNQRMEAKRKAEAEKALAAAKEFLVTNGKAEGVKQTASGLQYRMEKEGEGKTVTEGDQAVMNYKGHLLDGTVFEKNPDTGPAKKQLKMLPKGMQEGLSLMKAGAKATFWVPPALAFGENGRLPHVKGNTVVVYDVELLGIEPAPKPAAPGAQPSRSPITAVTPPITVEFPPKTDKPAEAPKPSPAPPAPPPAPAPDKK